MQIRKVLIMVALGAMAGCADDLVPGDVPDSGTNPPPGDDGGSTSVSGAFTHRHGSEGVVTTVVNASDAEAYQHLDLDTALSTTDATKWDLAFSRFHVRMNGGASGSAGVQVAALEGSSFESVTKAPEEGFTSPVADGPDDDDAEPDNAFNNGTDDWYEYELSTHTLSAKDVTYVVASSERRFYKIRFESYYDGAGSPGFVTFRWAEIEAPDSELPDAGTYVPVDGGVDMVDGGDMADGSVDTPDGSVEPEPIPDHAFEVDASSTTDWVYLSIADGVIATPADPEIDLGWDLAIRRTVLRTNSGTSGAGAGGALLDESGLAYDDIESSPATGFTVDEVITGGAPGSTPTSLNEVLGGWYDYNPITHVEPSVRTYIVRGADGSSYAKLHVWAYSSGVLTISLLPL